MSDKPLSLDDINETLAPQSLRLVAKRDENGNQDGFIPQDISTGDTWFEILHNIAVLAVLQVAAFIQGVMTAENLYKERTRKLRPL